MIDNIPNYFVNNHFNNTNYIIKHFQSFDKQQNLTYFHKILNYEKKNHF